MSTSIDRLMQLSHKRLVLLAHELDARLNAVDGLQNPPVAVVGIGCRLPGGVTDPETFWTLLSEGHDAIVDVPADRWPIDEFYDPDPDVPGKMNARGGGFLDDLRGFDAEFFGISPREAETMDPQQRLMLEVAWEALEHAGINPERLRDTATGVFAGVCSGDYYQRLTPEAKDREAYVATGNATSVVSGRVSYVLGLQGPSLSVDTACSASLVAVHLACQSLKLGECTLALAGGVNVICGPDTTVMLSKAHMLAADARCKTFDARADGFVRGEGCGIVVLKRLADAIADGNRVLAIIRGSAINQDGRSSGLTAPNGPSQEAVVRAALAASAIPPAAVSYVEAHGTGTSLGDPIEVRALGRVFADRPSDRPLTIGSVKTNIGHLEAAAGVAGLIKVVLALQHGWIPPHLHLETLSPHIDWHNLPVVVSRAGQSWPEGYERRIAGVSSFGFSGTNAHVVLEEAPIVEDGGDASAGGHVFALSARNETALRQLAHAVVRTISDEPRPDLGDLCRSANGGRAQLSHRLAVTASSFDELRDRLEAWTHGEAGDHVVSGCRPERGAPEVVFLFPGQGAHYPAMSRELARECSGFRRALERCAEAMDAELPVSLDDILAGDPARLTQTGFAQPAIFAVEYALASMWREWGVTPALVIGHSLGEITAACVAGVLSLADAARLVAARGRLMESLAPGGGMAAVFADEARVARELTRFRSLSIAGVNAPDEIVVSGDATELERLRQAFTAGGVQSRRLSTSRAFHSAYVEPMLAELGRIAETIEHHAPRVPLLSNLTGAPVGPVEIGPSYWQRHAREAVRFADAVKGLPERPRVFLEVGPGTTLLGLARRSTSATGASWLPSMRPGHSEWIQCLDSLAALWTAGGVVDWSAVNSGPARHVALPRYPFQHVPYWANGTKRPRSSPRQRHDGAVLSRRLPTAVPTFEIDLSATKWADLTVHQVGAASYLSAAFLIDLACQTVRGITGRQPDVLEDIELISPVRVERGSVRLQTTVRTEHDVRHVEIHATDDAGDDAAWRLVARLRVPKAVLRDRRSHPASIAVVNGATTHWSRDTFVQRLASAGVDCGETTGLIAGIWRTGGDALMRLQNHDDGTAEWTARLLDAALLSVAAAASENDRVVRTLARIGRLIFHGAPPASLWVHAAALELASDTAVHTTIAATDDDGNEAVRLERVRLAAIPVVTPARPGPQLYEIDWREAELPSSGLNAASADSGRARGKFEELAIEHGLARYESLSGPLSELATGYARAALAALGALDANGRPTSESMQRARRRVVAAQQPLFDHISGWFSDGVATQPASSLQNDLETAFPEFEGELRLLGRCGPQLASVLAGDARPLDLLFGDRALIERLYQRSPSARCFNALAAFAVAERARSGERPARILEVGAGTGGTTAWTLPGLGAHTARYVFTDLSTAFFGRAAQSFAAYPFVEYRTFDVEQIGEAQGFEAGAFDIVLAANVLHATADLKAAIRHVRDLLAPAGRLVLIEGTTPQRWVDVTFGLTDGWWRFLGRDQTRSYPLIDANGWRALLKESGFDNVRVVPDDPAACEALITADVGHVAHRQRSPRSWTIVGPRSELSVAIAAEFNSRGDRALAVASHDELAMSAGNGLAGAGVVFVAGDVDDVDPVASATGQCAEVCALLRLAVNATHERPRVWAVTRGAQSIRLETPVAVDQAALWGLGPSAALELPETWGGLIDVDPRASTTANARAAVAEILGETREDRVVYRSGTRLVPRLVPCAAPDPAPFSCAAGSWLITGGLGAVGSAVAEWLARHGARHLVLVGRTARPLLGNEPAADSANIAARLIDLGVHVESVAGDVSDGRAVEGILARFGHEWPVLQGVVHAAGVFDSRPLVELTGTEFDRIFAAKARGAWHLHQRLPATTEHFFLFSSTAAILGGVGQAQYAAANAIIDGLAHFRRHGGGSALSINWGLWSAMRGVSEDVRRQFAAIGFREMAPDEAMEAMPRGRSLGRAQCCVASIDWATLRTAFSVRRPQPLLEQFESHDAPAPTVTRARLIDRIESVDARDRGALALDCVSGHIADILRLSKPSDVAPERGFFEMGMDSLMSVELRQRLEREVGRPLPSTITFNYASARALSEFIVTTVSDEQPRQPGTASHGDVEDMSEDELASTLERQLERLS